MKYIKAIQIVVKYESENEACAAFGFLMDQDDCYCGRVYFDENDQVWVVQTINAPGDDFRIGAPLPESMRYVFCPTSLLLKMESAR
jgi:hypothetical protein